MKERILNYIKKFGSINTKQAVLDLGCCDLQHYIMILRREMEIKDKWVSAKNRYGETVSYKEYFIDEK